MRNVSDFLVMICCCLFVSGVYAQSNDEEIVSATFANKKAFEGAGPIAIEDMPVQSRWYCDGYTVDLLGGTVAFRPRQFDEEHVWEIQQAPFANVLKVSGSIFELTNEGLESSGVVNFLFRKKQDGQILIRIIHYNENSGPPIRMVEYGTCLRR